MSNAIEDPRVRAAIEHYLLDLENTQPKNTKRNYRPKQEEWKEWCQANWPAIPDVWPASVPQGQQLPGDLVDEGKLLLFMKEVVASRPPKKGKRVADERKRHLEAQEAKRAVKDAEHHQIPSLKGGKVSVFQRSEDWYETKVLRRSAKEPQAPLSGQTAREWTSRFYKKAGIKVSKVSHAPRVAATQNADMAGVDEGQIRRAGRWNNGDQMTGCYLTSCLSNS
ncbi:centromere DNA-binding protein complex CBF3 subunit [Hirsutella rhossiliensis]|uniref:Centromere DNA-binding protein complex CBF3 subunit n=1 Tax=Hirsutella rhossiliensis TaxID=111463 RepID=A0A9P8MQP7_9HYPO|nr:centromere DNA-binding protein complex CBF3 subunit [Hirsutella rhossiliensis]XP_044719659.1 centromere DNA-binding protein complex CBF3 subunit [Hirsutella rhossiliensis]XP_044720177.1 centromere DNA-binding protein complex CBF3 subunit [Hirsutella rhossiliensis]KAH0959490.1 centromere DNA-binding protein complex CBF3 subunit [Hirsutella rhossiliensis]KAH0962146.1 centromere DNA-binding protein complex CBF3 subunit [Hirsutella rhossiliensis]KAH0962664.1 centromere DNA-binding protein compl